MSNPFTIREAVDALGMTNNNNNNEGKKIPTNERPVDLLGAIVSIVKKPSSPLQTGAPKSKVELWITDQSLVKGESACVLLYGFSELSRVESDQVQSGDVVRFNGVSLKKNMVAGESTYYFTYSYTKAEPGTGWHCFNSDRGQTSTNHNRIPQSMQTLPQRIQDLKHYWKMTHDTTGGRLSPLPCEFRSLTELQVSAGLTSNISVRVQQYERIKPSPRPMKKRRFSSSTAPISFVGFATVTDSAQPNVIMTLIDRDNRFGGQLREARDTQKVLTIHNVFTKKRNEVLDDNCALGEVVLEPSKNTVMAWGLSKCNGDHDVLEDSMPSTLETERGHPLQKQNITSLGCLTNIEISRKMLHESKLMESPASFVKGVLTSDQQSYRSATLHLEPSATTAAAAFPREALATPDIMQTLCGGIGPQELAHHKLLQENVYDVVQTMLLKQPKLKWTIQMDCQPFRIERVVSLPTS